jgi:hypothetical protein
MRWKFGGQLGRLFRRLWLLMVYSQLASPLVALLAILTASALGIDTDSTITQVSKILDFVLIIFILFCLSSIISIEYFFI